ncbi:MAG: DUF2933 domain-containing protein, partial [Bradymonadaceae bacterium]
MTNSSEDKGLSRSDAPSRWFEGRSMTVAMLAGCLLVAVVVVWKVGISGVGNSLFLLILLACPLIHFFIHRG